MPAFLDNLDHMLSAWNSKTEDDVREHVDAALEHNVHFVDPNHNIMGRDAFVDMVLAVQAQIPGAVYSRASNIDIQNNHCRYHWEIHRGGDLLMQGFDVTEVNDAGRIVKVIGFFGDLERDRTGQVS